MAAAPTRHLEIETKLDLAPGKKVPDLPAVRAVRAAGLTGWSDPVVHELDATYYDTEAFDLLAAKITLRRRTGGQDAGWHLKLPARAGGRTEVGLPLEAPSMAMAVPAALADLLLGVARGRPLRPVARVRNRRTVRRLMTKSGLAAVEVADDRVTASPLHPDGAAAGPERQWRELEAELLDGTLAQLQATSAALVEAGAKPSASPSKLARALALPSSPPTKRKRPTSGEAVITALSRLQDGLIAADLALRDGRDNSLHDARTATRRLRSVLGVFASLFEGPAGAHLQGQLREHGRILSVGRDLEVLQTRLAGQLVDEPAEYARAATQRLEQIFGRRQPVARAHVHERIQSAQYLAMLRDIDDFLADPPFARRAGRAATAALPGLLDAAWRTLRERADLALADPDNTPAVHAVRKQAKVVRYATEAAVASLGDDAVVFAAANEEIQEVLGEHQDAVMSATLLAELALDSETDGVAGFVFGRLHAFEQAAAHAALDDFADAWDRVEDGDLLAAVTERAR